jgi:hypothetical protein
MYINNSGPIKDPSEIEFWNRDLEPSSGPVSIRLFSNKRLPNLTKTALFVKKLHMRFVLESEKLHKCSNS